MHRFLAGLVVLASACGLPEGEYFGRVKDDPDPTHLHWCNSGEPEYLDPALVSSTTGLKLVYAMFTGLTDHNMQGLPEPAVATSWDITADQRTFVFHLRDDAKWSNGRPMTADDFVYSLTRVLHPLTGSANAETLWKLKNGELYTANRVRMVMSDDAALAKGSIVELVGYDGQVAADLRKLEIKDSNKRTADVDLQLRDHPAWPAEWKTLPEPYAKVPAGEEVTIIDLWGDNDEWAYIQWFEDDGVYGWVETKLLTGQPNKDVQYTVHLIPPEHQPGVSHPATPLDTEFSTVTIQGGDLLMLPEVLGARAIDEHTLVLETWGPVPYLIDLSPQRSFRPTPREAVSRKPKRWIKPGAWKDRKVITSGAFTLDKWVVRDRVELVKSPTFFEADDVKLERITAYSINDQAASANYYLQGGCDATTSNNMPSSYLPVLNGIKTGKPAFKDYTAAPYLGIYLYLINTEKLTNVHLRRALNYAVDRRPIPSITKGGQIPTAQFMPGTPVSQLSDEDLELCGIDRDTKGVAAIVLSGEICYVPPQGLDFDLEKAKAELELARKEMGAEFPKKLSLKFNSGTESHKLIAEYMQEQWRVNLGLKVELQSQEWKTFLKDTRNGEYEVARMGWIGNFPDPEGEFLPQFKCDSPDNRTKFCNPEFERLYKQAEATADRKKRLSIIKQAEKIMVEDAAIIPLYVYTQHHLQKPFVKDLAINPVDQVPLRKAWIDPDWRQHQNETEKKAN